MNSSLYEYNVGDILSLMIAFVISIIIYKKNKTAEKRINLILILLIVEHLGMTFSYYIFSFHGGPSDVIDYFERGVTYSYYLSKVGFQFGTSTIVYIVHYLNKILGLKYFGLYWPFSIAGLIGIIRIFDVVKDINSGKWTNLYWLFLLPNFHFWSCAIGKDSIAIYAIGSLVYLFYFRKKFFQCLFAILLFGTIRAHIIGFILIGYFITIVFKGKKLSLRSRILSVIIMGALAIPGFSIVTKTLEFKQGESITERFSELEQITSEGGGTSVDTSGKNIVVKWVSYIFRPLFFDSHNFLTIIASLENTIWGFMFFYFLRLSFKAKENKNRYIKNDQYFMYWFSLICIFSISIPNAYILYNLGLAMRQKYMIFPFVLTAIFILSNRNSSIEVSNGK